MLDDVIARRKLRKPKGAAELASFKSLKDGDSYGGDDWLLGAVFAAVDDDKPRLVYADGLQEQGDVRAELIILPCKLGRTLWHAGARNATPTGKRPEEVKALKEREVELFKRNEKQWVRAAVGPPAPYDWPVPWQ